MRQDLSVESQRLEQRAGDSKLLSRLYRDVGMAAVAAALDLQISGLEPEVVESIERGASLSSPSRATLAA